MNNILGKSKMVPFKREHFCKNWHLRCNQACILYLLILHVWLHNCDLMIKQFAGSTLQEKRYMYSTRSPNLYRCLWYLCPRIFSCHNLSKQACMESVLQYTDDDGVVFTKNNNPLSTLERGQLIRVLCDSSSLKTCKTKNAH